MSCNYILFSVGNSHFLESKQQAEIPGRWKLVFNRQTWTQELWGGILWCLALGNLQLLVGCKVGPPWMGMYLVCSSWCNNMYKSYFHINAKI